MKTKFSKFVRSKWSKSEYAWIEWDSIEEIGTVQFNDGIQVHFDYYQGEFNEVEL